MTLPAAALWVVAALAIAITVATPAIAAPKKGTALAKTPKWRRPATSPSTELLVVVNTLTLHPGTALDIPFSVRNGHTTRRFHMVMVIPPVDGVRDGMADSDRSDGRPRLVAANRAHRGEQALQPPPARCP
jgi:hypothetical protein